MNTLFDSRNSAVDFPLLPGFHRSGWRAGRPAFEVFRWLLSACLAAGFAFYLSAGEPSLSATDAAAKSAVAAQAPVHSDRALTQPELRQLLTAALQREYVQNRGQLKLEYSQPWKTIQVPDVPLSMKILHIHHSHFQLRGLPRQHHHQCRLYPRRVPA